MLKRSSRHGVEDRWHRPPRRGEDVPDPADSPGTGVWCMDAKHGNPGTLVTTARHGHGKRWLARWVDHDGQERSRAFDRKTQAQAHITEVTTQLTTGTYADPRRGAVTFGTVAEDWFTGKSATVAPKTAAGYRRLLDVVILPRWRDVRLREIDHPAIQAWVSWLSIDPAARQRPIKTTGDDGKEEIDPRGLSPARVIQTFQVLDWVLAYSVRSRYIAVNPAEDIALPRKASREDTALTHEQVRQLADAREDIRTMVYLLAYSGMRYGELAALRVGDVDLHRRRIRIARSVTYVTGTGHVEGDTKTHQGRMVPVLTDALADVLTVAAAGRDADEYLFPHEDGGPTPLDWFRWRFDKAAADAGLTGISPKTLRHTAGSLALASGASVVTVSKLLGHRNVTTTMNIYSHMLPDDFDALAAAMDLAARSV
jgi:integrase